MIRSKLTALNHPTPTSVNCEDAKEFRCTVLWLEDQKIRFYKIEDRAGLRKFDSPDWDTAYEKFKKDLGFPLTLKTRTDEILWLLNHAIRLEYFDNVEKYRPVTAELVQQEAKPKMEPTVKSTNQFDNLDFDSEEFKNGIRSLANKLGVAYHPDHLQLVRAVNFVVKNNLSVEALKEAIPEGKPFPYQDGAGFQQSNSDMEHACRILRLLQVQSLRKLQTSFNETVVSVQKYTANPKTDTKLGQVGMGKVGR